MPITVYAAQVWTTCLVNSLEMSYLSEKTGRPISSKELRFGIRCKAHPQFAPHVVAAMDASLSKVDADSIYKQAFQASKPRAEAMLRRFDRQQHAGHAAAAELCMSLWLALLVRKPPPRQTLRQNALVRFSTFASSEALELLCK